MMTALITGASGGLGRVLAMEAARRGYDLVLTDMNADNLEAFRQGLLRQFDIRVTTETCDVTSADDVARLFGILRDRGIRLTMLFNVAGVDYEGGFLDMDCEQVLDIVRVNIEGTMRMLHGALRHRELGSRFTVVMVSSLASLYPIPLKATYAASKRFLLDFATSLSQELSGQNVSILTLCPGGLPTTPGALQGINAQGFWGRSTTNSLTSVARHTIDRALHGKHLYIPGLVNRTLSLCGMLIPRELLARMLYLRWLQAREGRPAGEKLVG
jgi:short-subunit dehydrogenase